MKLHRDEVIKIIKQMPDDMFFNVTQDKKFQYGEMRYFQNFKSDYWSKNIYIDSKDLIMK